MCQLYNLVCCEGTECEGTECMLYGTQWMVYPISYNPMLIPGQLRFSLYSGAVITEGRCSSIHCLLQFLC